MTRPDNRGADQLRKIKVTQNYTKYAEGSCLMEFGDTRVICTASVEENVPLFLRKLIETEKNRRCHYGFSSCQNNFKEPPELED